MGQSTSGCWRLAISLATIIHLGSASIIIDGSVLYQMLAGYPGGGADCLTTSSEQGVAVGPTSEFNFDNDAISIIRSDTGNNTYIIRLNGNTNALAVHSDGSIHADPLTSTDDSSQAWIAFLVSDEDNTLTFQTNNQYSGYLDIDGSANNNYYGVYINPNGGYDYYFGQLWTLSQLDTTYTTEAISLTVTTTVTTTQNVDPGAVTVTTSTTTTTCRSKRHATPAPTPPQQERRQNAASTYVTSTDTETTTVTETETYITTVSEDAATITTTNTIIVDSCTPSPSDTASPASNTAIVASGTAANALSTGAVTPAPKKSSHAGAIVGGVIGGVALIAAIATAFFLYRSWKQKKPDHTREVSIRYSAVEPKDEAHFQGA